MYKKFISCTMIMFSLTCLSPVTVSAFPTTKAVYVLPANTQYKETIYDPAIKSALVLDKEASAFFKKWFNAPATDGTKLLSNQDKVYALYGWFDENIKYDESRAKLMAFSKNPPKGSAMYAYKNKKGTCVDISELFYAILKLNNVEVQIMSGFGDNDDPGHLWNKFFNDVTGKWETIDIANMLIDFDEKKYYSNIWTTASYSSANHKATILAKNGK